MGESFCTSRKLIKTATMSVNMSSTPSTVSQTRSKGFGDLPLEVRNRIYAICAYNKERLVEKHVSRRNATTTSDAFWAARGYYGLTQVSRQTRQEFRALYLRD